MRKSIGVERSGAAWFSADLPIFIQFLEVLRALPSLTKLAEKAVSKRRALADPLRLTPFSLILADIPHDAHGKPPRSEVRHGSPSATLLPPPADLRKSARFEEKHSFSDSSQKVTASIERKS